MRRVWNTCLLLAALLASGCGEPARPTAADDPGAVLAADPAATAAIQDALSHAINEATVRYAPLQYEYDEDLLAMLDQIDAHLAGDKSVPAPRFLAGTPDRPRLDEPEELDHYRETLRRWKAATGKDLRALIDPLKAEVAARQPAVGLHPDFHKRFSAALDDLIKIEVAEMRERRNRAIHAAAEAVFAKYRATHPALVRHFEATLDAPPYNLPAPTGKAGAPTDKVAGPGGQ
jgi:hypothetical protein